MSRVTLGASEALARFVAGPHDDAAFEAALEPARVRLLAALSALEMPNDSSALAARALASYGAPLRRAFVEGTRLGAAPVARADAPIVAAALTASALAGHGETDVLAAIAVGREDVGFAMSGERAGGERGGDDRRVGARDRRSAEPRTLHERAAQRRTVRCQRAGRERRAV